MEKKKYAIWNLLASICLIYYFVVLAVYHTQINFMVFWLLAALAFWFIGFLLQKRNRIIHVMIYALLVSGILIFVLVQYKIIGETVSQPTKSADYIVVLGAKVNGTSPSLVLSARLKAAEEYLENSKETKVIVTGAKGNDEKISEAECMYNELIKSGINKNRIQKEEKATDTKENLVYAKEMIENEKSSVVVVSSDFHLYRAKKIAEKCGYENVSTLSAPSPVLLIPNFYVREFFAVVKDTVMGNL